MFLSIKIILKKPLLLSSIDSFLKLYNSKKIVFFLFYSPRQTKSSIQHQEDKAVLCRGNGCVELGREAQQ